MPKAFVNGIRLHYVQTGKGPDLVLIHGIASNLGQWQLSILPALVEDFRVTMYDLRGHGYSDMPPEGYALDHMVDDFNGLTDYLRLSRVSIVGHSYGGLVALRYAALHPQRVGKLIIADTAVPSLQPMGQRDGLLGGWREALRQKGLEVPDEKAEDVVYLMEQTLRLRGHRWRAMGLHRAMARLSRLVHTTSIGKEFRDDSHLTPQAIRLIQTPVLLIYGERSPNTTTLHALRQHLPQCTTAIIYGGGHFYPLDHPRPFVRHIKGFLQGSSTIY
jgi:pimeloyl-ACP methyl ester carboxylesterase